MSSNNRIAKNTLILYVRMIFSMAVSLYTSRVVLSVLGVEDFGVYNVVGGVVSLFSFLNASMSGATSRFLTYELGRGDFEQLKRVFSASLTIHILIAVLLFFIGETVGIWFLNEKLVIPAERLFAAQVVFQFSLASAMLAIVQVPYNATIIAHEKMSVYAYIELLRVTLRLLIVFMLTLFKFDKLMLYGGLVLSVSVVVAVTYRFYCKSRFRECIYHFEFDRDLFLPMLSFSGWDLYGNLSVTARTQGVNMLLNIFFGPVLNAASGVATQVQSVVMGFAGNVMTAVRPQIVKTYAAGNHEQTVSLVMNAAKYTYTLLLFISLPMIAEMRFVMELWLKNVPDYAVIFCQLTLIFNFFANLSFTVVTAIHATGKIKRPSLINGTLYLAVIPVSYFAYKYGGEPQIAYYINIIFVICGMLANAWTLSCYVSGFSFREFVLKVLFVCLSVTTIATALVCPIRFQMEQGWVRFAVVGITSSMSIIILTYILVMDMEARAFVKEKVKDWVRKYYE